MRQLLVRGAAVVALLLCAPAGPWGGRGGEAPPAAPASRTARPALPAALPDPAQDGAARDGAVRDGAARGEGTRLNAGTYAYGEGERQRLIAYWHRQRGPDDVGRPAVVVLHGGYWSRGRAQGWAPWMRHFADAGTVVFDVDYRRNTEAHWPAQRNDVFRALHWIRQRADGFGVDPGRIVLFGSSAGGHLAAAAGTYGAGGSRVAGVVALSPPLDPYRAWRTDAAADGLSGAARGFSGAVPRLRKTEHLRANAVRLAGCSPASKAVRTDPDAPCTRVWRDMSAVQHASGPEDAPMLLIHSRHDFVRAAHSRALARAQRLRGMPDGGVEVVVVPGREHGGALLRQPGVAAGALRWIASRTYGADDE